MRHRSDLRSYQQRIITWLYEHDRGFCIARPGGGKTIAALTAGAELIGDKVIRHMLVIAPKRVARNVWPDEIEAWLHTKGLRYQILSGTPLERKGQLKYIPQCDVTIIGIDLVGWLLDIIKEQKPPKDHPIFDLLIIDEISKLRAPTGVRAKALAKVAGQWRMIWGLSGTLRPNGPEDLFMPARIVTNAKLWGKSFYQWRQTRFYPTDRNGYNWVPKPGEDDRINAEIAPWTVTLQKDELPQLPALSVILDKVTLPAEARHKYEVMHKLLMAKVGDKKVVAANAAVATGKLAQMANGFVYRAEQVDEQVKASTEVLAVHDEKRQWIEDLIEQADSPTIIVYEYLEDLRMLREILGETLPYLGAGVTQTASNRTIEAWNAGEVPFMALHPAAGGHGLNLQKGGSDMVWLSPTWSPEMWEQTIARLHRSGQEYPVIVRVCVATDTVDEMKLDRVHNKMTAQEAFEAYLRKHQQLTKGR